MKIKCLPEDFLVEELPVIAPADRGPFTFYRLTKQGLGTPEAIEAIRRRWNLAAAQVRYGGLKDRHARTVQYLTIHNGPERTLRETGFTLEPIGRLGRPYAPDAFRGNRFVVVIRDLKPDDAEAARRSAEGVARDGLPNYFDDQRFGSVGPGGQFIAHAWHLGDHGRALWLALAEPNMHDRPDTREIKATLREHWTNWAEAKARLPRSHERSIVTYLVDHPDDFRGAFARLDRDLRALYFSAFQSHLWNLWLGDVLRAETRPDQRAEYRFKVASLPVHLALDPGRAAKLRGLRLPLPSARSPRPGPPHGASIEAILAEYDLTWEALRVKHQKDVFLSKGDRPALFFPESLTAEPGPDELYKGRQRLTLAFELPRGTYATLLVKRVAGLDVPADDEPAPG